MCIRDRTYSVEASESTNELLVTSTYVSVSEKCDFGCNNYGEDDEAEFRVRNGTTAIDILDLIEEYYNIAKNWLAEVYEEIKFW